MQEPKGNKTMISFDEGTHTYTSEQGKELISVTTLLKRAGISPNYDNVNPDVLQAKAERGTLIHKEIEDYIKKGEIGFTVELQEFIRYIKENHLKIIASEKMVWNDDIAGTIDLIVQTEYGEIIYVDFKTTYTIHLQPVSWQLSIYKDLDLDFEKENYDSYLNATLQVWHFGKDGTLTVKELMEVDSSEIYRLYDSYINGTPYELQADENALAELYEVEKIIAFYEQEKVKAEENAKLIRKTIVESMKKQSITKFENDKLVITYLPPTKRTVVDTARLLKDHPELEKQYEKTSNVKEQVRIRLKENTDE